MNYEILLIFLGGGAGSSLRYLVSVFTKEWFGTASASFPLPTLIVNVLGSFLIGLFYQYSQRWGISSEMRLLLTTGFCGGFTTFSTFSYEGLNLLRSGMYGTYALYLILSLVLGLLAALLPQLR